MNKATITYNDKCVRWFTWASIIWGVVAMLAGLIVSLQLNITMMPGVGWIEYLSGGTMTKEGLPYLTLGRLRPVHTNAAIFAFVGNMIFAGVYYSTQRLCRCRVASDKLTWWHFWTWQLVIVSAAITLPIGLTQSKEYAELIWPIDLLVVFSWVVFSINFFWTLIKRNEQHLYVTIWFYIATIVTVAMLYIVNNLQIPTSLTHSYPIFGGVQDALVQWWYGHNAVAFFLTTPILGIMYYFVPKSVNRPVYSYRLSIVHFWALVFIYIWTGPHHLLNTSLPNWLQGLGMAFSVMLWAPSWAGMLNGLLTLKSAWGTLHKDPVVKFFAAALTFYGMSTFEGPLLAIKSVNALSHYTDWTIGHVHSGTLGWNGFMAAGMFYWLVPRLYKTELYSKAMANFHFWIGFIGVLFYVGSLWVSGITQGLMLADSTDGSATYKFLETLEAIQIPLLARSFGGTLYLIGFLFLAYNIYKTCRGGTPTDVSVEVTLRDRNNPEKETVAGIVIRDPFAAALGALVSLVWWVTHPTHVLSLICLFFFVILGWYRFRKNMKSWGEWHDALTRNYLPFTVLTFFAAAIGGAIQIIPNAMSAKPDLIDDRLQVVYTPLELAGRDVYVAEGCYNCHSQMIRMLDSDVIQFGDYSRMGESIYDYPFQWGSKRTGPDLAREGGPLVEGSKVMRIGAKDNVWHYIHLMDPREKEKKSNMPSYSSLVSNPTDIKALPSKIRVQALLGVPWPVMNKHEIEQHAIEQGLEISKTLVGANVNIPWVTEGMSRQEIEAKLAETEMVALIAYLQKIGVYEVPDMENVNKDGSWVSPDDVREQKKINEMIDSGIVPEAETEEP